MSSTEFINKYKPTKINEIIGNDNTINRIVEWITEYDTVRNFLRDNNMLKTTTKGRKKKITGVNEKELEYSKRKGNLLITGTNGCGKSTIIQIILKELDYDIINLMTIDSKQKIDIELINKLSSNYSYGNNNKKKVLLIDELESIISSTNKTGTIDIIKENNFKRWMPIIIITNNKHNKQLTETKKYSDEMRIFTPFPNQIYNWVRNICQKENIKMNNTLITKFIEKCQQDMRKILIQLYEIKINNNEITEEYLNEFNEIIKEKDLDQELFQATKNLLTNYKDIKTCIEIHDTEKAIMPIMLFENYSKYSNNNIHKDIIDKLSDGDIIENYIHGEQIWDLTEIHGLMSVAIPSYIINSNKKTKTTKIDYAADLNRTSVKMMNKKYITKIKDSLDNNKSIEELIYMSNILKTKIPSDEEEMVIKINKLRNTKI